MGVHKCSTLADLREVGDGGVGVLRAVILGILEPFKGVLDVMSAGVEHVEFV